MVQLEDYAYFFVVCEGTNEEAIFNFIETHGRLRFSEYSKDYMRAHTKESKRALIQKTIEFNYDGRVGVLNIRDRKNENWDITSRTKKLMNIRGIDIIPVVTYPEIEYLLILSDNDCLKEWDKRKKKDKQLNPSGFCKSYYNRNVKTGEGFVDLFNGFDNFYMACARYKEMSDSRDTLCLFDLIG